MASSPNSLVPSVEQLTQQLNQLATQYNIKTWCLAYSGGVDSQVLLHLLHLSKLHVIAVYIDHGLQASSAEWARHCAYQCELFNIPFQAINVDATPSKGEGPEAAARTARYAAFEKLILSDMCLLTAQHQDDQSETVLLQLLRGGSAEGLSAMPELSQFSNGWHFRPLLHLTQQSILQYAGQHNLLWVEDPSNQQQKYNRNYLRHSVIPVIKQRWPAIDKTLSVFSRQQAENARLLMTLGDIDFKTVRVDDNCLDISELKKLDEPRLRNTVRYWIKQANFCLPSRAVLMQIVRQLENDSHDTHSLVSWLDVEVRRFRDRLFILKKMSHDASQILKLEPKQPLFIASLEKTLALKQQVFTVDEKGLNVELLLTPLTIRFRQGGERIKPAGRSGSHDLKSLFQENAVPPWQRDRVPLLYSADELVAVVGYWLADDYAVEGNGFLPVIS